MAKLCANWHEKGVKGIESKLSKVIDAPIIENKVIIYVRARKRCLI